MTDRNRELVPHNWSLVRERALTTGLCSEGSYSEYTGVIYIYTRRPLKTSGIRSCKFEHVCL